LRLLANIGIHVLDMALGVVRRRVQYLVFTTEQTSSKYEACIKHGLHEAIIEQTLSNYVCWLDSQLVEPAPSCKRGI